MKEISLSGHKRAAVGKVATREMRKKGLVPCNIYGEAKDDKGLPVALSFEVEAKELRKIIYTPHVYVVNIDIDGTVHPAVIKEMQFHPVSDAVLHIDFYEISATKPIVIGIPVKLVGHAQGVRDGGRMNLSVRKLNVRALYKNIPECLEVDVTNLTIGKSIKVGDLHYDGIELATAKNVIVCSVKATRKSVTAAATTETTETPAEE